MKHEFKIGDKVAVVNGFDAVVAYGNQGVEEYRSITAGTMLWIVAFDGDEAECATAFDLDVTVELHNLEPWNVNAKA